MEVGILGPLRLIVAGEQRTVPPGRQRALLALLALRADRVVPADTLVDVVWGEDLPADPVNALQGRISQLRRLVGGSTVEREAAGYRLRIEPTAVDAHRFGQLAQEGHDRLAAGDARGAITVLEEALGLWRGEPLGEHGEEPWARGEAARLEERRRTAVEDRAEAALALGRHSAELPELEAALERDPLRERLRGLVMLAHYRAGRQTEALEVYERGRRTLAEELGLDPGPHLQRLHRDVLAQADHLDPEPEPRATARASVASPRPSDLPARLTSFVGREEEVERLRSRLGRSRLITLTGPGGAGKSRLAIETVDGLDPPDGVGFVGLAGVAEPEDLVVAVADAVGVNGSTDLVGREQQLDEQLVAALSPRRLVLVLDDCEHLVDAVARLTARLLAAGHGLSVLATSREPLGLTGEVTWSVSTLAVPVDDGVEAVRASAAAELLVDRLTGHHPGFLLDEDAAPAVAAICRRLDGIPLALELAAARARTLGVDDIAARLDDRFELLVGGDRSLLPRQRTLEAVIDWSWELLDDEHRQAAEILSLFASRFTLDDAEELLGAALDHPSVPVGQLVTGLAERSLLETSRGHATRLRMLETIRAYARRRLGERSPAQDPRDALAGLLAERVEQAHPDHPDRFALDLDAVEELLADVRAALHHVTAGADPTTAQRLAGPLGWYWWLRGRRDEGLRWLDVALADGVHDDRAALWAGFLRLGVPAADAGRHLEVATRSHDVTVSLLADAFVGMDLTARGRHDEAAAHLGGVVDRARDVGGWPLATAQLLQATLHLAGGHLDDAERTVVVADRGFEATGAWWGRLVAADLRGHLSQLRGRYTEAVEVRQRALEVARRHRVTESETLQTIHLGSLAALRGDAERARELHARAAHLAERSGERHLVAFAANGGGIAARRRGDLDEAERSHRRAAEVYEELGAPDGAALALAGLGYVAERRGDHPTALELHQRGFAYAERTGDPRALALALEGIAGALTIDATEDAARLLGAAEQLRSEIGAPLPDAERDDVDRLRVAVEQRLGRRGEELVRAGGSLSREAVRRLATGARVTEGREPG